MISDLSFRLHRKDETGIEAIQFSRESLTSKTELNRIFYDSETKCFVRGRITVLSW